VEVREYEVPFDLRNKLNLEISCTQTATVALGTLIGVGYWALFGAFNLQPQFYRIVYFSGFAGGLTR
jgi:hypothetical protein